MESIKKFKREGDHLARIHSQLYKGYSIGELPKKFAYIYNKDKENYGAKDWFNYKCLTYVPYNPLNF